MSRHYKKLGCLLSLGAIFFVPILAQANHATPERVVDNKYVVTLFPTFTEQNAHFEFIFRDIKTGKKISEAINFSLSIEEEDAAVALYSSPIIQAAAGSGVVDYVLPHQGIYDLNLEFALSSAPDKIYHPTHWSLWVPGQGTELATDSYPVGWTELASLALLLLALIIIALNWWWLKRKAKKL